MRQAGGLPHRKAKWDMVDNFYKQYVFQGSPREVGRQYGETFKEDVREHIELTYELAAHVSGSNEEKVIETTRLFQPYIEKYAPDFMTEIQGISEGAGIKLEEALLPQVRQEVVYFGQYGGSGNECTSYAVGTTYTADGKVYSGQNADLAGDFESVSNVVTFAVENKPKIMMLVPAGQISYIGINDRGLGLNCNFLPCNGWRIGFPRYLISRFLLEAGDIDRARSRMRSIKERASSRNLLLTNNKGEFINFEMTPDRIAGLEVRGKFVHSNHFLDPSMREFEGSDELEMIDSRWRLERLDHLIEENKGMITETKIKEMLRDHEMDKETGKFSICTHASKETDGYHTFASVINNLTDGTMSIAKGNPCKAEYKTYSF